MVIGAARGRAGHVQLLLCCCYLLLFSTFCAVDLDLDVVAEFERQAPVRLVARHPGHGVAAAWPELRLVQLVHLDLADVRGLVQRHRAA